jgi:hypothetical protein
MHCWKPGPPLLGSTHDPSVPERAACFSSVGSVQRDLWYDHRPDYVGLVSHNALLFQYACTDVQAFDRLSLTIQRALLEMPNDIPLNKVEAYVDF